MVGKYLLIMGKGVGGVIYGSTPRQVTMPSVAPFLEKSEKPE